MHKFKLALLQTRCVPDKLLNIQYICEALATAAANGSKMSILGEICNSPYNRQHMLDNAEDFGDSMTLKAIQKSCCEHGMYAIGTIPRIHQGKYFNTAFVINAKGDLQAQMDKIHLFDIDIPGKITYKYSYTFTAGDKMCVVDTDYGKVGIGICYDLRFPELSLLMAEQGARLLVYPGSFNQTTGPLHWELLLRARALDNQCFAVGVSAAQYKEDPNIYQAWGHSTAVDPFGKVMVALDENPSIGYCEIDLTATALIRYQIPVWKQKRHDIYRLYLMK